MAETLMATPPPPPCVTFRRLVVSLRGPGQSPVVPSACCIGLLLSVARCGRCSCCNPPLQSKKFHCARQGYPSQRLTENRSQ